MRGWHLYPAKWIYFYTIFSYTSFFLGTQLLMIYNASMSHIGTIRKTLGKPLDTLSPFQRLEQLRRNAKPFIKKNQYDDKADRLLVRKTVGAPRR